MRLKDIEIIIIYKFRAREDKGKSSNTLNNSRV